MHLEGTVLSESVILDYYRSGEFNSPESTKAFAKSIEESTLRDIISHYSGYGAYSTSAVYGYKSLGLDENDSRILRFIPKIDAMTKEELEDELVYIINAVIDSYIHQNVYYKEKQVKTKETFLESSKDASNIDTDEFITEVQRIIDMLYENREPFADASIPCYCHENTIYFVMIYKNEEIRHLGVTIELPDWLGYRYKKYIKNDSVDEYYISYVQWPDSYAEEYDAAICILTGVKRAVIPDNSSVFVTRKRLYSYISNVHGLTNAMITKFLNGNPDITTYTNMGTMIYLKKDIDSRVIRCAKDGMFQK